MKLNRLLSAKNTRQFLDVILNFLIIIALKIDENYFKIRTFCIRIDLVYLLNSQHVSHLLA